MKPTIHVTPSLTKIYTSPGGNPGQRVLKSFSDEKAANDFIRQREKDALRFHAKHPSNPGGIRR